METRTLGQVSFIGRNDVGACGQHGIVGFVRVRNGIVMIDKQLCKGYKTCCKHYKWDVRGS